MADLLEVARHESEILVQTAQQISKDSKAVRIIAVISLIYIPATLAAVRYRYPAPRHV